VQLVSTALRSCSAFIPRKGTIAIGSDADVVVFDANAEHVISAKTHHMRVDYSMFEGIRVKGAPKIVLSRGRTPSKTASSLESLALRIYPTIKSGQESEGATFRNSRPRNT